jgi:hypothetical protein
MKSSESTDCAVPSGTAGTTYMLRDIKRAVAFGEALGAFEQYDEYANSSLTLDWKVEAHKWTIIAEYDCGDTCRDEEAESTFFYHAAMKAPHAKAVLLDAEGNVLEPLPG